MKGKILKMAAFAYLFGSSAMLLSGTAHAYIDPSTTTYIIQVVAGILVAIGASFTIFRHKITAAWRKWYYGRLAKKNEKERMAEAEKENETEGKEAKKEQ